MEDEVVIVKRPKGRPKKVVTGDTSIVPSEPKKRGRKKKEVVVEENADPQKKKKRGRKPAIRFFSSSTRRQMPLTVTMDDKEKYIVHLDIKDKGVVNENDSDMLVGYNKTDKLSDIETVLTEIESFDITTDDKNLMELYKSRLELREDQDSTIINTIKNTSFDDFKDKDLEKRDDENKKVLLKEFIDNKEWLHNTDVCCWWCCHGFQSVPLGIPVKYEVKMKKYTVKGVFCSFGCMLGYNDIYKLTKTYMIKNLYSMITGIKLLKSKSVYMEFLQRTLGLEKFDGVQQYKDDFIEGLVNLTSDTIQRAPDRNLLKMFGGVLSIQEFRDAYKEDKIYEVISYPLIQSNENVNIVNLKNIKNANLKVFKTIKTLENSTNILDVKKINDTRDRVDNINNSATKKNNINDFLQFT